MGKELEREFTNMVETHKMTVIQVALVLNEDKGIYDMILLRNYRDIEGCGVSKAHYVSELIKEEDPETFEALYKYCWELVKELESMDYVV